MLPQKSETVKSRIKYYENLTIESTCGIESSKTLHSQFQINIITQTRSVSAIFPKSRKREVQVERTVDYSKATSIKSPASDDGHESRNNLKYTCHLNLKEGISNLKASYIPDFGYADQLNFSIDSQNASRASSIRSPQNNVNKNWKLLANQILLPFAPKYSMILRTLQESERRARQKEKLKAMKINDCKKCFKRIATKINITPLNSAAQKSEKEKQLKELQDIIFRSQSQPSISQKDRELSLKFIEKNLQKLRKIGEMKSEIKSIKDKQKKSEKKILSLFQKVSPKRKKKQSSQNNLCLHDQKELKDSPYLKKNQIFDKFTSKKVKISRKDLGFAQTCENLISIDNSSALIESGEVNQQRATRYSLFQDFTRNMSTFCPKKLKSFESSLNSPPFSSLQTQSPKLRKMSSKKKIQIRIQKCISKLYPGPMEKLSSDRKEDSLVEFQAQRSVSISSHDSITRLASQQQESWLKSNKNHLKPMGKVSTRNKDLLTSKTSYQTYDLTQLTTLKSTDIETRLPSHLIEPRKPKKKIKILPPIDILEQQRLMERAIESPMVSYAPTPPIMDNRGAVNLHIKQPMEINKEGGHWFKKGRVMTSHSLFSKA